MIKAIETRYKGYNFRSRLEARWAVFFDALGVKWEYEKEGYDLGEAGWYLPDFWLPDLRCWVEIKPNGDDDNARVKCAELSKGTQAACLLIEGSPGTVLNVLGDLASSYHMFLFGGEPWDTFDIGSVFEDSAEWAAYRWENLRDFLDETIKEGTFLCRDDAVAYIGADLDERTCRRDLKRLDFLYYERKKGCSHPHAIYGREVEVRFEYKFSKLEIRYACYDFIPLEIERAINAARSARFEHGQGR